MKTYPAILILAVFAMAVGCAPAPKSGSGFTLPEGDAEAGKATFVALQCNACHTVEGIEQPAEEGGTPAMSVAIGGQVSRIATYGELVTSIINPSHRLAKGYKVEDVAVEGQSKMTNYNDVLTVKQLCDLVSFLQSKYEIRQYEPTPYPDYGPYL